MEKVAFAGSGALVENLIALLSPEFEVRKVALSKAMPSSSLEGMIKFCAERGIKTTYDLNEIEEKYVFTPNYPLLIKQAFLDRHECVNVHFALLPRYRGFHPVQCALLNDEKEIGYSVHKVDAGLDSGPIYFQEKIPVSDEDDVHSVIKNLSAILRAKFLSYVREIIGGKLPAIQDERRAIYAGKRRPEDGIVDWNDTSRGIFNLVRAIRPPYYPGAYTFLASGSKVVIISCKPFEIDAPYRHIPGQVVNVMGDGTFLVKTGDGLLKVETVMVEGKKGMALEILGRPLGLRFYSAILLANKISNASGPEKD